MTIGLLLGAPLAGALYGAFGFHGPFIFGVIVTVVDLVGRLLVIERKDALRYGHDPTAAAAPAAAEDPEAKPASGDSAVTTEKAVERVVPAALGAPAITPAHIVAEQEKAGRPTTTNDAPPARNGLLSAALLLGRSPRAMTAYFNTFAVGYAPRLLRRPPADTCGPRVVLTALEPALPLHMQAVWGYDATKVGLVTIAATVPTALAAPLAGWASDRAGPEALTALSLLATLPWLGAFVLPHSVVLFIFCYALICACVRSGGGQG
jgi:DHA1 family solute carrier family 18 vesicular amine transporter 1/2